MGFGYFVVILSLTPFFKPYVCQVPNTDEPFIFEFLQKLGLNPSKDGIFSGPLCSWRGIICDANGENVVKLNLSGLGLSGVIPDNTIGKLIKLESLDLSNNKITKLPTDFYSLGSLKYLNLSLNQISGSLLGNIGDFIELQSLDLSANTFSGSIPEAISSLISLQSLNLSRNQFESIIPLGILKCRLLHTVDLSQNRLNGYLPIGFSSSFPEMKYLNMAENRISGRASDFVGMNLVKYINISGNLFKGPVIGFFKGQLEFLDLSRNQFQGHIDQVNFFNWSNLVYLDLSENQFSGVFFSNMNGTLNLKHINLAHNRFTKQQFLQVDKLTTLEYLNLSQSSLFGRIPNDISHLSSLKTLDLSKNNLSDHIPRLSTKNLKVLDFSYNKLSGEIPLMLLQELVAMERFNFSYNNLSLCSSHFSNNTLRAAFIGSVNSCPIAANPIFFKRNARKGKGLKLATILTLSMICLLVGLLLLAFGCRRKSKTWAVKQNSCKEEQIISGPLTESTTWSTSVPVVIFNKPLLNFTFGDLLSATSRFDRDTLLAEGHFGPVYGGTLPGGIHIAVKVLVNGSTMTDEEAAREFEYIGRIKHPNLVPLSGYCLTGEQRIAIYDYMGNGNLENLLHDRKNDALEDENNGTLNVGEGLLTSWRFRHKIMLGIARALAFLHHGCSPPIIHRDVKARNVYFDFDLEPRLSDFGLSRLFGNEVACGSRGYTPPEFIEIESSSSNVATPKCDVYGFGVVLFELISGKRPLEDDYQEENEVNLVSWVRGLVRRNYGSRVIDPKIRGLGPDEEMVEALKIGYLCTAEIASKRPSMQQVVGLLKDLDPIT